MRGSPRRFKAVPLQEVLKSAVEVDGKKTIPDLANQNDELPKPGGDETGAEPDGEA